MTEWTVVNPGPCPTCSRHADLVCADDRHWCADCGTDRGPCDKSRTVIHVHQPTLFPENQP